MVAGSCSNVGAQPHVLQRSELKCAKQLNMAVDLETNVIAVGHETSKINDQKRLPWCCLPHAGIASRLNFLGRQNWSRPD